MLEQRMASNGAPPPPMNWPAMMMPTGPVNRPGGPPGALVPIKNQLASSGSPFGRQSVGNDSMIVGGLGAIYRLLFDWHSEWLSGVGAKKQAEALPVGKTKEDEFDAVGFGKVTLAVTALSAGVTKAVSGFNSFQNQVNSIQAATIVNRQVLEGQAKLGKAQAEQVGFWSRMVGAGMAAVGTGLMFVPGGQLPGAGLIAGGAAIGGSGSIYEAGGVAANDKKLRDIDMQKALMQRIRELSMYSPQLSMQVAMDDQAKMHRDMAQAQNPRFLQAASQFSRMQRTKDGIEAVYQEMMDEQEIIKQRNATVEAINEMHRNFYAALKTMNEEQKKYYAERLQQEKDKAAKDRDPGKTPLQEFLDGLDIPGDNLAAKNDAVRKLRDAEIIKPLLGDL
jgi:hypothetical protein